MRFYRIASLDGGGGGWNTEGEYKVKKKKNIMISLIKGWIIMLPFLRRKILVWSLISYLTLFFQNFNNEVLSNCQFGWKGMVHGPWKEKKKNPLIKGWIIMLPSLRRKILVWPLIHRFTLFFFFFFINKFFSQIYIFSFF